MNKIAKTLNTNQFEDIINAIRNGFVDGKYSITKPNDRVATALVLSANTGIPMMDIVKLKLENFVEDEYGYLIYTDGKKYAASKKVYEFLENYAKDNGLNSKNKLFDLSTRAIQNHLRKTCNYLGFGEDVTTESFKRMFSDRIYSAGCKPNVYKKFYIMINE